MTEPVSSEMDWRHGAPSAINDHDNPFPGILLPGPAAKFARWRRQNDYFLAFFKQRFARFQRRVWQNLSDSNCSSSGWPVRPRA